MHENVRPDPEGSRGADPAHGGRSAGVRGGASAGSIQGGLRSGSGGDATRRAKVSRTAAASRGLSPHRTSAELRAHIEVLRRQRRTGRWIAQETGLSSATVSRVLRQAGVAGGTGAAATDPALQLSTPGELIHLDTKKLGRIGSPGHRVTGNRAHRHRGIGWTSCMWPSTITRAWLPPPSRPTSAVRRQ